VSERARERGRTARETTDDGSRQSAVSAGAFRGATPLAIGIVTAALVAAALLVATEFSTVASVKVANTSCEVIQDADPGLADRCSLSGFERNGGSFLLVAGLIAVMGWGAGIGCSRAAAAALVVLGVAVLAWSLLVDLPVTDETGALGSSFEGARAQAGLGLTLEIVAGLVAIAAGALRYARAGSARVGRITPKPLRAPRRD
jgi:hypothetical protein